MAASEYPFVALRHSFGGNRIHRPLRGQPSSLDSDMHSVQAAGSRLTARPEQSLRAPTVQNYHRIK